MISLAIASCDPNTETQTDEEQINFPAEFSGDLTATVINTVKTPLSGTVIVTDKNNGENRLLPQVNQPTNYGSFSIDESGHWLYTLISDNDDVNALSSNSPALLDAITLTSIDNTQTQLTITINGADNSSTMGFSLTEGGNHFDGYTNAVPKVNCSLIVDSLNELEDAAKELKQGDTLCLQNGVYQGNLELRIEGVGTAQLPITVAAQVPGISIIENGEISVRLGGEHIVLQGFVFRDGRSGSSIIKLEQETECRFCRITEVSIIDMDNGEYDSNKWVEYYGQYNRIDHNWFSGKESRGALLVLPRWINEDDFNSSGFPADYAQIDYNYFGHRPPAFGKAYASSSDNEYEAVRLGLSTTHSAPSHSILEHNYFEFIQGEAEVISNKAAQNIIRNNTIRNSHGSIVNRHGAKAIINSNIVIGDDHPFSGGIRLVDDGHAVVNNYIVGARYINSNWNGGIVLTTGDNAKDTDNGYQNVSNVYIGFNTIIDSVNSVNVYGGKNNVAPRNIYFSNNLIGKAIGPVIITNNNSLPIDSHFENNIYGGPALTDSETLPNEDLSGFIEQDIDLQFNNDSLFRLKAASTNLAADLSASIGEFTFPDTDIDGQIRSANTIVGADEFNLNEDNVTPLTSALVGPISYRPSPGRTYVTKENINNYDFDTGDLSYWTTNTNSGASISQNEAFSRGHSLVIDNNATLATQTINISPNTNYTLSAFMKGTAKLSISLGEFNYPINLKSDEYKFNSVSFNSGSHNSATIIAQVNDQIELNAEIENPNFNEQQQGWHVVEGKGIGQVQDSNNSASGHDGSIKFKFNADDSGVPYFPYIAQSIELKPNTDYELSFYNLYKNSDDDTSIFFGLSDSLDVHENSSWIASKRSVYSQLKTSGNKKGDDSFYQDTLTFNSGDRTAAVIFAQYHSTNGNEIRVDDFKLTYKDMPEDGSKAYFDNIRLVSHPLSPAQSAALQDQ